MDKKIKETLSQYGWDEPIDKLSTEQLAFVVEMNSEPSPYGSLFTIYDECNEDERNNLRKDLLKCIDTGKGVEIYPVLCEGVKTDDNADAFDWMERHSCWYKMPS
jgi:hypothetical protein